MITKILTAIAILLIIDVFAFLVWITSGQLPADIFYLGSITAHVLQVLIF